MICVARAKNEYVVKIHYHKLVNKGPEDLGHDSHKAARSICESEWHNQPFEKSILHFKGHFPLISCSEANLMVPTPKINLRENLFSM